MVALVGFCSQLARWSEKEGRREAGTNVNVILSEKGEGGRVEQGRGGRQQGRQATNWETKKAAQHSTTQPKQQQQQHK